MQIHQYKLNGYNMVLDVPGGSVHVVDDVTYDALLAMQETTDREEIKRRLAGTYSEQEIREARAQTEGHALFGGAVRARD